MAESSPRAKLTKAPSETEELDGFDDFTIASTWERVISAVEGMCREWQSAGPSKLRATGAQPVDGTTNLYHVDKDLSYGSKGYRVGLFFRATREDDTKDVWRDGVHRLQLWFGVRDFVLISPVSMSGVVLDAPDVTMLLSAAAVALSNCNSEWPVFVPVHDPTRKAYRGIEATKFSYSTRFEADRITSRVPVNYMHLEGLYDLFVSKVGFSSPDFAANRALRVGFTMKLTYRTPMKGFEYHSTEGLSPTAEPIAHYESAYEIPWDHECPWAEWHSLEDPVKGFELIASFGHKYVTGSSEMAENENISTFEADKWLLRPILSKSSEDLQNEEAVGFAGPLRCMVKAFDVSKQPQYMEKLATGDDTGMKEIMQSAKLPAQTALDRTIKDLFFQAPLPVKNRSLPSGHAYNIKAAPANSLLSRLCLHALYFGGCNIRAIAVLWMAFVREVRYCWDEAEPLPGVAPDEPPDLSTCLLQQKLQLLALCIKRKRAEHDRAGSGSNQSNFHGRDKGIAEEDDGSTGFERSKSDGMTSNPSDLSSMEAQSYQSIYKDGSHEADVLASENNSSDSLGVGRKGSAGPVGTLMLLNSYRRLHAPITQTVPSMTEDMLLEREHIIAALSLSSSEKDARVKLQSDILASDMAGFKAANPGAAFEDFVRWNSPRDWTDEKQIDEAAAHSNNMKGEWPPTGRLSARMVEPGNAWIRLWDSVRGVPIFQQRPLFDYTREAEKVMHYLDTVRPQKLLAQMLSTAFVAAADILHRSFSNALQPLAPELEDLFSSMAAVLQPLEVVTELREEKMEEPIEQWVKDLVQLCTDFESMEARITLGVSLAQKLKGSSSVLSGLINKYLGPDTHYWTGATNSQPKNGIVGGALVNTEERRKVGDLFPPLSSNLLWKRSLRMGNYLNGHEPLFRELIFTCYEDYLDWHLERVRKERNLQRSKTLRQMHSHRMYVCGTPNDLQVAFSVVASD